MNNTTVQLYRDYQRTHRGGAFPPAVVVMTSYLEDIRGDLVRATGISYEVPGVTALAGLRSIVKTPVSRVGVVHGRQLAHFIDRQRALATSERIPLLPVEIASDHPTLSEVRAALVALRHPPSI